jgi:hypothetical protein
MVAYWELRGEGGAFDDLEIGSTCYRLLSKSIIRNLWSIFWAAYAFTTKHSAYKSAIIWQR